MNECCEPGSALDTPVSFLKAPSTLIQRGVKQKISSGKHDIYYRADHSNQGSVCLSVPTYIYIDHKMGYAGSGFAVPIDAFFYLLHPLSSICVNMQGSPPNKRFLVG